MHLLRKAKRARKTSLLWMSQSPNTLMFASASKTGRKSPPKPKITSVVHGFHGPMKKSPDAAPYANRRSMNIGRGLWRDARQALLTLYKRLSPYLLYAIPEPIAERISDRTLMSDH